MSRKTANAESAASDASTAMTGLDLLGHTFNAITDDYAMQDDLYPLVAINGIDDPKNTHTVTSDANDEDYEIPVGVSYTGSQPSNLGTTTQGDTKSSYSSSLSASASIDARYGLYSGSVDASYGTEVTSTNEEYYLTTFDSWSYYDLGLSLTDVDVTTTDLEATDKDFCLTADMQAAFDGLEVDDSGRNAKDFFTSYGTHVLIGVAIGGQCRYSMYGSQYDFESEQEFNVNAEAEYSSLTGSAAFATEIDGKDTSEESSVQSQTSIQVLGGSAETRADLSSDPSSDDYKAWEESIAENLAWIDYQSGGVSGIWALCDDPDKSSYLEAAFGQLYGSDGYSFETYDLQVTQCTDGNKTWNSDPNHNQSWTAGNETEVIVGFGGNINSDKHVGKLIIITYDLVSGDYATHYTGGGDPDTKWEAFYMAPTGSAITGIGMSQASKDWSYLHVWYQKLQLADQNGVFLDPEISEWTGSSGDSRIVDPAALPAGSGWCADGSSTVDQLQRYFRPDEGNTYVLTGIDVNCSNSVNGFNYLTINQELLRLDDSVTGDDAGQDS